MGDEGQAPATMCHPEASTVPEGFAEDDRPPAVRGSCDPPARPRVYQRWIMDTRRASSISRWSTPRPRRSVCCRPKIAQGVAPSGLEEGPGREEMRGARGPPGLPLISVMMSYFWSICHLGECPTLCAAAACGCGPPCEVGLLFPSLVRRPEQLLRSRRKRRS